jgi:hypothetical protein
MSQRDFMQFLCDTRDSLAMLTRYAERNLAQLMFHAKNEGYEFSAADISAVVGGLEANVILKLDGEPMDGSSSLWRGMWGRTYLEYVIADVVLRHTDHDLWAVLDPGEVSR